MAETTMTTTKPQTLAPQTSKAQDLKNFLEGRVDSLAQWVKGGVSPQALVRFALLDYSQSKQLQECTRESIYLALVACAQFGLEPGALKQEAFIVPYKDQATFMLGWRGMVILARRSGLVTSLKAQVVYDRDVFDLDLGSDERVIHKPCLDGDRGGIRGCYAIAKMTNGEMEVEWMPMSDLQKVREQAKRGPNESPAYRVWEDQMYRKAPIRRLSKRLPLGEVQRALEVDRRGEEGDVRGVRQALDVESVDSPVDQSPPAEPRKSGRGVAGVKAKLEEVAAPQPAAERVDNVAERDLKPENAAAPGSAGDELSRACADIKARLERVGVTKDLAQLLDRIAMLPPGPDKLELESLAERAAS